MNVSPRDLVDGGLRRFGFQLLRWGQIGRTLEMALTQLRKVGFTPASVVDVGVADGTPDLYRVYPDAQYLLVEPVPGYQKDIVSWLSGPIRGSYEMVAAGASTGWVDVRVRGVGSSALMEKDGSDLAAPTVRVPLVTVDALRERHGLQPPHLVKITVQGSELDVLKGSISALAQTEAVVVESALFRFQQGRPLFSEVMAWLDERGFTLYDVCDGLFRPYDGALAQFNAVYVRTDGWLRQWEGFAAPSLTGVLSPI